MDVERVFLISFFFKLVYDATISNKPCFKEKDKALWVSLEESSKVSGSKALMYVKKIDHTSTKMQNLDCSQVSTFLSNGGAAWGTEWPRLAVHRILKSNREEGKTKPQVKREEKV